MHLARHTQLAPEVGHLTTLLCKHGNQNESLAQTPTGSYMTEVKTQDCRFSSISIIPGWPFMHGLRYQENGDSQEAEW